MRHCVKQSEKMLNLDRFVKRENTTTVQVVNIMFLHMSPVCNRIISVCGFVVVRVLHGIMGNWLWCGVQTGGTLLFTVISCYQRSET